MIGQSKSEIGLFLGASNSSTDVASTANDGQGLFDNTGFAWGLNYTYNFNSKFGLRLGYKGSKISGGDQNLEELNIEKRGYTFTSPLHELGLMAQYNILKPKMNEDGSFKKSFIPYVLFGGGVSYTKPEPDFTSNPRAERNKNDIDNTKNIYLEVPYGVGVKYNVSEKFHVDLEFRTVVPMTDYLDGISESANPDRNDVYYFLGLNVGMKIGMKDRDHDGIADDKDSCPDIPGISQFNGCPDTDGDGITDSEDLCPLIAGSITLKGCPDTDGDGVADRDDKCPEVAGTIGGCPDTDGDGIIDKMDKCPTVKGVREFEGCLPPDTDGDGVIDSEDRCPKTAGTVKGCPDTDGDGVVDIDDNCPKVKGIISGCPDTDKDGIRDIDDRCPKVPGIAANKGCPVVKKEVQDKIIDVVKAVYFRTGSDILKVSSKRKLKELVSILNDYPELNMIIEGHTDSRGDEAKNMDLSQRRADSVKAYLVKKGLSSSRFTTMGYGETLPVADNKTNAGRKLNRRVELKSTF